MFTDEQKMKARHHLGYLNVGAVSTFVLGVPAALPTLFTVEGAWDKILPEAEILVDKYLCRLDQIDRKKS